MSRPCPDPSDPFARLAVRPITPDDRDALAAAFARLSPETRRRRFLGPKPKLTARELVYLTNVDHVSHEALVAVDEEEGEIVAVARYATGPRGGASADMAVTVADDCQGRGIGTSLAARIVHAAHRNGIASLTATTMWENRSALALLRRLGFRATGSSDGLLDLARDLR
jgi:RimJ/RimL family protein N-acetyltransferase